uniref:Nucleoside-triphosphatase THEP1 n=1 Tax=Schistocephalus solidus TaxID=70667 RepID=A0A0X3PRV5_SCHSO
MLITHRASLMWTSWSPFYFHLYLYFLTLWERGLQNTSLCAFTIVTLSNGMLPPSPSSQTGLLHTPSPRLNTRDRYRNWKIEEPKNTLKGMLGGNGELPREITSVLTSYKSTSGRLASESMREIPREPSGRVAAGIVAIRSALLSAAEIAVISCATLVLNASESSSIFPTSSMRT